MFNWGKKSLAEGDEKPEAPEEKSNPNKKMNDIPQADEKTVKAHGFDPTAFERAAAAARALDSSKNAQHALELSREHSKTLKAEHDAKRAQAEAYAAQLKRDSIEKEAEEARRTLQHQSELDKRKVQYQDQLERQRFQDQFSVQKQSQEEERRRQMEAIERQEAIRRKTLEYEFELRQKSDESRVKMETAGKIRQERENHDLHMEQERTKSSEFRTTVIEAITHGGRTIGTGLQSFLTNREQMMSSIVLVTAILLGMYVSRTGVGIAGRFIESRLGKPSLVRETSRRHMLSPLFHPIDGLKRVFSPRVDPLSGIILKADLKSRLMRIADATRNTSKHKANFQNVLLYGPPGTGKTLFARQLALHSNMDFAIMTGGDVTPLGKDGVTEIHKLFDWSKTTSKGMILFVDEADAFLRKRLVANLNEEVRNSLNAFLYRTGTPSNKIMVMFASNQPQEFDWAIYDRIDEMISFELPATAERFELLKYYFNKTVTRPDVSRVKNIQVAVEINDDVVFSSVADKTSGFSAREIHKLAQAWQACAYANKDAFLSLDDFHKVLQEHLNQKLFKQEWNVTK